jgi:hypothetical protein
MKVLFEAVTLLGKHAAEVCGWLPTFRNSLTSVTNYQTTPRNIQEERKPQPHRGESLISRKFYLFYFAPLSSTKLLVSVCIFQG